MAISWRIKATLLVPFFFVVDLSLSKHTHTHTHTHMSTVIATQGHGSYCVSLFFFSSVSVSGRRLDESHEPMQLPWHFSLFAAFESTFILLSAPPFAINLLSVPLSYNFCKGPRWYDEHPTFNLSLSLTLSPILASFSPLIPFKMSLHTFPAVAMQLTWSNQSHLVRIRLNRKDFKSSKLFMCHFFSSRSTNREAITPAVMSQHTQFYQCLRFLYDPVCACACVYVCVHVSVYAFDFPLSSKVIWSNTIWLLFITDCDSLMSYEIQYPSTCITASSMCINYTVAFKSDRVCVGGYVCMCMCVREGLRGASRWGRPWRQCF